MEEKHETKALALKEERVYIGDDLPNKEDDNVVEVIDTNPYKDKNITNVYNTYVYNDYGPRERGVNKLTALLLCIFFGSFGVHKFYEGKVGMGILYLFTFGLFGIGWLVDIILIAFKPNPYYVNR